MNSRYQSKSPCPAGRHMRFFLSWVLEAASCPETNLAGLTREIFLGCNIPVTTDFYENQTHKVTCAISVHFSEAGVCFVANWHCRSLKLFSDPSLAQCLKRFQYLRTGSMKSSWWASNCLIWSGFFFPIRHADVYIPSLGQETSEI